MTTVQLNPDILKWARETAGFTLDVAAKKLGLNEAYGVPPAQRLEDLENGIKQPTRPQLLKMVKQYRRPLVAFYMENPPIKGNRGEDFRHLPDNYTKADDARVDTLLRNVRSRQRIVQTLMQYEEEAEKLPFIGSVNLDSEVEHVCDLIRNTINFDLNIFRSHQKISDAFTYLRTQVEAAGVFVLIIGDLGSHHTNIPVEMFRGFALADDIAPFIVVNNHDARAAWAFTLIHELTHLWLGQTGVSGSIGESRTEKFCNDVAGEFLLPKQEINDLTILDTTDFELAIELISNFATERNISRSIVAYKLYRVGNISFRTWDKYRLKFKQQWIEHKDTTRIRSQSSSGGPDYYVVKQQRVGTALINFTSRMVSSGVLTATKAGKILGVKPQNVYTLMRHTGENIV